MEPESFGAAYLVVSALKLDDGAVRCADVNKSLMLARAQVGCPSIRPVVHDGQCVDAVPLGLVSKICQVNVQQLKANALTTVHCDGG